MGTLPPGFEKIPVWLFFLLIAWLLFWKGMALWKAARQGHKNWFIALLILSTVGILEIIYLAVFTKKEESAKK